MYIETLGGFEPLRVPLQEPKICKVKTLVALVVDVAE